MTTHRLKTLKAQKEEYEKVGDIGQNDRLDYLILRAYIRGYEMAMEHQKPALHAAQAIIDECEYCQASIKGTGICSGLHKVLRDALAGLEE